MTYDVQDTLIYRADFNVFDEHGKLLKTSLYHGYSRRTPRLGERAILKDAEGNTCWGTFRESRGVLLFFELDDSTWVSGDETQFRTLAQSYGYEVSPEPVA